MNKALWAIIAAAALGATKKATSKGNIGSFNELTDKDVFDLVGRLNGIKSFEDFMEMTKDERELLKIQAGFIINEASSNPNSILAQRQTITVKDIQGANRNKGFRKNIQDVAIRKANKYIESLQQQRSFKQFSRTSPTRKKIQRQRSKPQLMADSVLAPLDGNERGLLDSLYLNKDYTLNPESFVSFIRLMCSSWYPSYNLFPVVNPNEEGILLLQVAAQDAYEYNPLTDQYGPITSSWAKNCLDKMVLFKETADKISIAPSFPINEQAYRFAYLNFYDFYVDVSLFERIIDRWKASNGELNSIIMKELHMLVFGVMYKISKDYLSSELFSFLFFSDVSGQTILPFGNCSFESYKEILENRLNGTASASYKYNRFTEEGDYITAVYMDGLGSLFDRLIHKSWTFTLSQAYSNPTFLNNITQGGDIPLYFALNKNGNALEFKYKSGVDTLSFYNEFNYKINDGFPQDDFNRILLWYKSEDFRKSLSEITGMGVLEVFNNKSGLYAVFGLSSKYGEEDPMVVILDNFFEIENKLLRLGNWASECCVQMTKVVNSGQIGLALYLLSPIIDFSMIDLSVEKYNLPVSLYPKNVKKQIEKRLKDGQAGVPLKQVKNRYVSPQKAYFKGTEKMKPIKRVIGDILSRIKEIGTMGSTLSDEMNLPMNILLWKYMMIPDSNMDFSNPMRIPNDKLVKKIRHRYEAGLNNLINGEFIPYYIFAKDDDKARAKALKAQKSKASAQARSIFEQAKRLNMVSFDENGQPFWADQNMRDQYESAKVAEYMAMSDNQTYERLMAEGKTVLSEDDFTRLENYKKFMTDGSVKVLDKMVKELARKYSADTQVVSSSPFNKIVGLFFGGDPSQLTGEQFEAYYKRVADQTKAIPTQSLTYSGIDMVPTVRGLNNAEVRTLEENIRKQREEMATRIAEGAAAEGSLESLMLKFIDKSLSKQSVFGVPYIGSQEIYELTGIDFLQHLSKEDPEELTLYSRDGQVENLNGFFPKSTVKFVNIPEGQWSRKYETGYPVENYIQVIHNTQSVLIGGLLQELFSRFSSKTSNYGDIGNIEHGNLMFYTKVKKVGNQLAVLGDDPLGFREMYRNLAKHSTSLEMNKQIGIQVLFDPNVVKNRELAKNSSYSEENIGKARRLIKIPTIQQLVNDCFSMEKDGTFECVNSPQSLQKAILDILGVFTILDERIPGSRSEITKQQKEEFYKQYDLYLAQILDNLDRLTLMVKIYDIIVQNYGLNYLPAAEYSEMSVDELQRLISRYQKYGPYRTFYGVEENFPQSFMDLVNRQIKAYDQFKKGDSQEPKFDSQYDSFDERFQDTFRKSFVEKQSEKIGALIGILPVGEGYRVYLPYTIDHIRNVARAGNKNNKHKKIVDLKDSLPYSFSSSVYCIADSGQRSQYIVPWERGDIMHLVVVSPDGNLHSLMTFDLDQGSPSRIQQWRAAVNPPTGNSLDSQPRIMDDWRLRSLTGYDRSENDKTIIRDYYHKNFGMEPLEVLEVDSKIIREFAKLMYSWLQKPQTFLGAKMPNTTVEGASYSWTDRAASNNWTQNSRLLKNILDRGQGEKEAILSAIDIGVIDSFKETQGGFYSDTNVNKTFGDIDVIRNYYDNRLSKNSDLINEAREARIDKLKRQRKL